MPVQLPAIQTAKGHFTIAAADHRGSLAQSFGFEPQTPAGAAALTQLKVLFVEAFSDLCSGFLVDPLYGFPAIAKKAPSCGVILSLEASGYTDDRRAVPTMISDWSVRHVKNNYGIAKLLLYYHPAEQFALEKRKLLMELAEYCRFERIPFLVEPVIFNPVVDAEGKAADLQLAEFQKIQLQVAQEFQKYCDVLKLQYPGDALACATLSAEVDIPWILLSRGMPYDKFRDALQVGMENGASGFAAGRSVWQEVSQMKQKDGSNLPDFAEVEKFLQTTGRQRMQELVSIAEKP